MSNPNMQTRCDRALPSSGCVALQIQCRTSKRSPEKRQRVLLSDKYTNAIVDVNRKLDSISHTLSDLTGRQYGASHAARRTENAGFSPALSSRPKLGQERLLNIPHEAESFRGPSSFEAHARQLKRTLRTGSGVQQPSVEKMNGLQSPGDLTPQKRFSLDATWNSHTTMVFHMRSFPPFSSSSNILQLSLVEMQRFFIDAPVIDEEDFIKHCKDVYFGAKPRSISAGAIAGVGLYYLIHDMDPKHYYAIGLTTSAVQEYLQSLSQAAIPICRDLSTWHRACIQHLSGCLPSGHVLFEVRVHGNGIAANIIRCSDVYGPRNALRWSTQQKGCKASFCRLVALCKRSIACTYIRPAAIYSKH